MKSTMKKSLAVLTLSAMMTTGAAYASTPTDSPQVTAVPINTIMTAQPVSIQINGEALTDTGFQPIAGTEPMIPLRAVTEKLGFALTWNQENLSVDLIKGPLFTTVKTGEDVYTINKMLTTLGAAPELVDNKLYVPASFASKILHGSVVTEGNSVSITLSEPKKSVQASGVITAINNDEKRPSVHIQGVGTEGIVLNVGPETVIQQADGTKISLSDLHIGMTVDVEHSMVTTMSLPPQTPTYSITVRDAKAQADMLGTAGEVVEVRSDEKGNKSVRIKGQKSTDLSQEEVVLNLTSETAIVDKNGAPVEASKIEKGTKVIGFYGPAMTRSLPPIGTAWKIVVDVTPAQK